MARENNLNENSFIYTKRKNNIILDISLSENNGYMKEKLGKVILEMEEK